MDQYIERAKVTDALIDNTSIFGGELEEAVNAICAIPAADVQPVRHGWWIMKDKHIYQCNRCGNYLDIRGLNGGRGDANYCPNCGAAMSQEAGG